MASSTKETYCLCGQPYNIGQFMIECDCCREWFHGSCVDVKIYHSDDIDKYHCPKCAQTYGPSVLKVPTNKHRADRYELGAETRPSQVGTPAWVRALAARPLRPTNAALQKMRGNQFTEDLVKDNGFTKPIFFPSVEGLDMKMPNSTTFSVRSVLRYCGAQLEVEVIDVRKQATLRMPLGDFVEYFESPPEIRDEKVLNVISLEVSDTSLSPLVEPPAVVRRLDWAETAWPAVEERPPRPAVQKYCLMSAAGSYTDFHVDFGGTTVWYHVMHGRKVFYLIPPTSTNLALYQQWSSSNNQNERFFGDMVEWYGTVELVTGQTLFIPSGWIHAVLTPRDSLVFGGNLLHSYAIETQLQIYEIERRVETPLMFRYPLFEAMHWYAAALLLTMLRRHNEETQDEDFTISESYVQPSPQEIPPLLLRGIKILCNALKEWHALKVTDSSKRDNVPKCLNSGQLVRELCKELRILEKRSTNTSTKDKDFKVKSTSPNKSKKQATQKKSLKLTLPKPIMHMAQNNGEFVEDKIYADRFFIDNKEVIYQDNRYVTPEVNGLPETKYYVDQKEEVLPEKYAYQSCEEPWNNYQEVNSFVDKKSNVVKYTTSMSASSSQEPPPYPEHSILKDQLTRDRPRAQWTISKKDLGYQEQQILYTNDNLQPVAVPVDAQDMGYGPGMYSVEDVQPEYQTVHTAQYTYARRFDPVEMQVAHPQTYTEVVTAEMPTNGYHQYQPAPPQYTTTPQYITEEPKPQPAAQSSQSLRRSERPVRRRVSNTYDYEDADLYIDDTPPPSRKRSKKHTYTASNSTTYRQPTRPVPTNGIESLIQASVLAEEEAPVEATEDAAVEGMLSISERYSDNVHVNGRTFGLATDTSDDKLGSTTPTGSRRSRKPLRDNSEDDFVDEEDVIKEVHRDEEYVYPSLDMSSDEDEEWTSPKKKRPTRHRHDRSSKDEPWSPRARVGRLVPRARPPRAAPRPAVRAALSAAAALPAENAKRAVLATKSKRPPPPVQESPNKNSRLKKGMKTAKQRLGKILKIHKMIY